MKLWAEECLGTGEKNDKIAKSFQDRGLALQDIVNELGRRLDYKVENGLYQGKKGSIGNDGLWKAPDGHILVVETKITDDFKRNLATLITYRQKLMDEGKILKEDPSKSSVLLVVGRSKKQDLEAQIRGSRYAWDIRIISVSSLIKLVEIKEDSDEEQTLTKISRVLVPFEYTRLDQIIDIMFTATKDIENNYEISADENNSEAITKGEKRQIKMTPRKILDALKQRIIGAIKKQYGITLIARTRAQHWSSDRTIRLVLSVSKWYERDGYYWYAYHPRYDDFLSEGKKSFVAYGRVGGDTAYVIPYDVIQKQIPHLSTTKNEDGSISHWHVINVLTPRIKKSLKYLCLCQESRLLES